MVELIDACELLCILSYLKALPLHAAEQYNLLKACLQRRRHDIPRLDESIHAALKALFLLSAERSTRISNAFGSALLAERLN